MSVCDDIEIKKMEVVDFSFTLWVCTKFYLDPLPWILQVFVHHQVMYMCPLISSVSGKYMQQIFCRKMSQQKCFVSILGF